MVLGAKDSGSWLTAVNLMHIMGVEPGEALYLDPSDAVKAVLLGEADAMFYVAGKPVTLFEKMNQVKANHPDMIKKIHFVPLQEAAMLNEYVPSQLSSEDYEWLEGNVPTIAVKAMLVSFDFSARNTDYYRRRCREIGTLGRVLRDRLSYLQPNNNCPYE